MRGDFFKRRGGIVRHDHIIAHKTLGEHRRHHDDEVQKPSQARHSHRRF